MRQGSEGTLKDIVCKDKSFYRNYMYWGTECMKMRGFDQSCFCWCLLPASSCLDGGGGGQRQRSPQCVRGGAAFCQGGWHR